MLITDRRRLRGRALDEVVALAVEGGVNVVQLREKDFSGGELYDLAIALRSALSGRALLIVNDRLDVALAAGADGVHLPEHSIPAASVWELAGDLLVGRSVHSVEAAVRAAAAGVDYVQVGTVYETASKPGVPLGGIALVRAVAQAVRVPVVAVGGVMAERVPELVAAGADGVAVIGAILDADDPQRAARGLRRALDGAHEAAAR